MTEPRVRELRDERRPDFRDASQPRPVRATFWYPETPLDGRPLPVVLLSHGTGGSAETIAWLAEALADAGTLAVGVDHHGNHLHDAYLPQGFVFMWERARDLSFVLDVLQREKPALGPVGAAGFSAGGYTAAALLGARVDPSVLRAVADGTIPMPPTPEFPNLLKELESSTTTEERERALSDAGRDFSDERVRAAFLVCPAVGGLVADASLAAVRRPVEIRWADPDTVTPPAGNAERYLATIPTASGRAVGDPEVGHYGFLDHRPEGAAARREVAADAVAFFRAQLGGGSPA